MYIYYELRWYDDNFTDHFSSWSLVSKGTLSIQKGKNEQRSKWTLEIMKPFLLTCWGFPIFGGWRLTRRWPVSMRGDWGQLPLRPATIFGINRSLHSLNPLGQPDLIFRLKQDFGPGLGFEAKYVFPFRVVVGDFHGGFWQNYLRYFLQALNQGEK